MQNSTIKTDVCSRLGISYADIATNSQFSATEIQLWVNQAMHWALNYKKWPFLESSGTDLIDATGTYPYPTKMKHGSAFLVTVAGKRYVKIEYEHYLKYLEEYSTGTDKVWSEYDRNIYINGNACTVGNAVIIYGQIAVADLALATDADLTPFADSEFAGDEAIVLRATAIGLKIKKQYSEARLMEAQAEGILNNIWSRIMEAAPRKQSKGTKLFKRINILKGTIGESTSDNVGRFD